MNLGHEDEHREFKRSTSEMKEGMESIASILNKHGEGELYFGVRKDGEVCGQDVSESTLREISQAVGNSIAPAIYPEITHEVSPEGKSYVLVRFSGDDAPYSCNGRYRIRVADEDKQMSPEQLRSHFRDSDNERNPWDGRVSNKTIADIDEGTLRKFVERGREKGRIPFEYTNAKEVLEALGLVDGDHLLNAAEVLFCPSRFTGLKMGILASHARTDILDLKQEEGIFFDLVDKAEWFIITNTRSRVDTFTSGPSPVYPEIPRDALREGLMNAFAHRDWQTTEAVVIDIYNDAVEIMSPGWFIEGQDPESHLSGESKSSISRNPLITRTLYRSGDIEAYGTGIRRIKDLCDEANIEVEYARTPSGTDLIFHRNDPFGKSAVMPATLADGDENDADPVDRPSTDPVPTQLTDPVAQLCAVLVNGPLSISEAMGVLGLSQKRNFRERYLNPALELDHVERTIPDKPNSSKQKYKLTSKGKSHLQDEMSKIGAEGWDKMSQRNHV